MSSLIHTHILYFSSPCVLLSVTHSFTLSLSLPQVKNIVARMSRREIYMALLWLFIGLMLVAAIVLIIYFKFASKPST
jgi:hypothetical protein